MTWHLHCKRIYNKYLFAKQSDGPGSIRYLLESKEDLDLLTQLGQAIHAEDKELAEGIALLLELRFNP